MTEYGKKKCELLVMRHGIWSKSKGETFMAKEKVFGKVMQTRDGIFEVYEIDRQNGQIGGYKLFPAIGESNPYRIFDIKDVRIESLRKH